MQLQIFIKKIKKKWLKETPEVSQKFSYLLTCKLKSASKFLNRLSTKHPVARKNMCLDKHHARSTCMKFNQRDVA